MNPNSAAARRRQAAGAGTGAAPDSTHQPATATATDLDFTSFHDQFEQKAGETGAVNQDIAFSTSSNPFASVNSECDEDAIQQQSMLTCGLNMSFLHDWIRPAGEANENNGIANDGNDIFGAFDNVDNNTPSAANAFANFDTAWGDVAPDSNADKNQSDGSFTKFELANDQDRSPPRRSASGKDKKTRKPRRKSNSGNAPPENSSGGEGLNDSFNDMNVSNPDADGRKHRRERGEGEKRPGGSRNSGGERRRRPKEGEEDPQRSVPRRNRSGRDASRTTG